MSTPYQLSMWSSDEPSFDGSFKKLERTNLLFGAWIEQQREWMRGHDTLFDELSRNAPWKHEERPMYGRTVEVPRLVASLASAARGAIVEEMRAALEARYEVHFERVSAAYYRNGKDSVAFHGDTVAREIEESLMASVSVGAPRRFLLRPTSGGPSTSITLGSGDLMVMGGTIQRTYQHAIPKVANAGPRIVIMFRPLWSK